MPILFASSGNESGYDMINVTPSGSNVDLTDPDGPTAGLCARALYIEGAGNVAFQAVGATGTAAGVSPPTVATRVVAVPDSYLLQCHVQLVVNGTTTATGIWAVL